MLVKFKWLMLFLLIGLATSAQNKNSNVITLLLDGEASPRIVFGANKLQAALSSAGYTVKQQTASGSRKPKGSVISLSIQRGAINSADPIPKEGYRLQVNKNESGSIIGADASGVLYGCLALAEEVQMKSGLPNELLVNDAPEMVLRGTCIGIQKPYYLPGRTVYEYPYTPETFPWLYDKQLWLRTLDSLVVNRYNSLYLWNGHPFASLVKVKDYPYALEVDEATFKKNEEIYKFITEEADKRGIWVIQMFYNIIIPKPFAEKHGLKTQDRERPIIPIIADYTRKSIAAFVEKYPNVGLLVTLGEAMEGVGQVDVDWFTKTIIPGVQDGIKALGKKEQPPIVLRAHDTDASMVMDAAMKIYTNLYTMAKYNGEALTTYTPRGTWAELHQNLSAIGTVHIENVHILANLEPFRYAAPDFIRKCVQAMHQVYNANGLHLYPQASYWDWPWAADSANQLLYQIDRDWLWYRQWARYAWKSNRDATEEDIYWSSMMAHENKTNTEAGKLMLEAYNHAGEISPKILRRFGITDGNRQTSTLGMTMPQLVNPFRFGLFTLLYTSEGPEGEMLIEYAEKEAVGEAHIDETSHQIIHELKMHGDAAVAAIERAAKLVTNPTYEFLRIKNDMYIHRAMAYHYAEKATAALHSLRYKYTSNISDLELAVPHLEKSVKYYEELTRLTNGTYRFANSMQTAQRKIPFRGVDATYIHWREVLPQFQNELSIFKNKIDSLQNTNQKSAVATVQYLIPVDVQLQGNTSEPYDVNSGNKPFADLPNAITNISPQLTRMKGIQTMGGSQINEGTTITFNTAQVVHLLIGYFNDTSKAYLQPPQLETNANANEFGQAEVKIANGIIMDGLPPINIHSYTFLPGQHTLKLAKGKCIILGFTQGNITMPIFDASLQNKNAQREVDWLFE